MRVEEEADLDGFDLEVADLGPPKGCPSADTLEDLLLRVHRHRLVEFGDQVGEEDVPAGGAPLDGADQEAGSQPVLPQPVRPSQTMFCALARKSMVS